MAASLGALRDDHVRAGSHGGTRLGHGCGGRPPRNPARLYLGDELLGVEAHDRRDDARIGLKHRLALGGEIGRGSLTRLRCHRRAPMPEKFAHPRFVYRIARRWWVRYPIIELKTAVAAGPPTARPDLALGAPPPRPTPSTEPAG